MHKHTEARLEDAIIDELTAHGGYLFIDYRKGPAAGRYDKARALDPALLLGFIQATQPKVWQSLTGILGADTDQVVLDHLGKELETRGMLKVLRQGFKCYGKKVRVAVFAPNNRLNPDTLATYGQNVLSVTRQLFYSDEHTGSLDLRPVPQRNTHRDGGTQKPAFRPDGRARQDAVQKTTGCAGADLRVQKAHASPLRGRSGRGVHDHPAQRGQNAFPALQPRRPRARGQSAGYRTAYLWREVWRRDSLLDILGRFMHLQVEEKRILTDEGIRKITKETMIFPRYHQLQCVRRVVAHATAHGPGRNYLIQHSAGSGKSNSIAWLAHRLSSLHDAGDKKVFDSVIVVTDRRVLD